MTKWEYTSRTASPIQNLDFNEMGAEGWEMCGCSSSGMGIIYFYFKRPVEERKICETHT
jgi:hypothetical protein